MQEMNALKYSTYHIAQTVDVNVWLNSTLETIATTTTSLLYGPGYDC